MGCALIRLKPDGEDRKQEFLSNGKVGVRWNIVDQIGDLRGKKRQEIKELVKSVYPRDDYSGAVAQGQTAGMLDHFINKLSVGSFVLSPDEEKILIGEITGDYYYDAKTKTQMRDINWITEVDRAIFSEDMRRALKNRRTMGDLTVFETEVAQLVARKQAPNDQSIDFQKLIKRSFEILQQNLESSDQTLRTQTAVEILRIAVLKPELAKLS